MAGRGRGRGKVGGFGNPNRPGENSNGISITKSEDKNIPVSTVEQKSIDLDDLTKDISALKLNSSEETFDEFAKKAKAFASSDERYLQLIDYMYHRAFEDNDFAPKAALIANRLTLLEDSGSKFRSNLLKRAQEHYKNREQIREKSLMHWTGLISLICEVFKILRIRGSPLKPLSVSVYQMLSELLQGCCDLTDREGSQLECFYQQFKNVGPMLEDIDQQQMDSLMRTIRDTILSERSTAQARCLLTEAVELRASKWLLNKEVERFYSDAMADILATHS